MFHGRVVAQAHLIPWQQNPTHMLEFARVAIALAGLKIIAKQAAVLARLPGSAHRKPVNLKGLHLAIAFPILTRTLRSLIPLATRRIPAFAITLAEPINPHSLRGNSP